MNINTTDLIPGAAREVLNATEYTIQRVQKGRFQRWLALTSAMSGALAGFEVALLHYRGSYSRRIMYTPVILSGALLFAGLAGFRNARAARTILPATSWVLIADGVVGFCFHVRGIQRKPGGWRLPSVNLTMGPPLFAPLLLATGGYLGVVSSYLQRDDQQPILASPDRRFCRAVAPLSSSVVESSPWRREFRHSRLQKHMAAATAISACFSGFEAFYSHYKNNFQYKVQWTPIIVAPALAASAIAGINKSRAARTILLAVSLTAMANGAIGFFFHSRGVKRRPGGWQLLLHNLVHGPPVFAPLLFSGSGFMGLLASLLPGKSHDTAVRMRSAH